LTADFRRNVLRPPFQRTILVEQQR
jgi:hypothetical protein